MELICPDCRSPLSGLSTDRIFTCADCGSAILLHEGRSEVFPLHMAVAHPTSGQMVWLPFWRMAVAISVADPDGVDVTARSVVAQVTHVWVCAFFEHRPACFGNPGFDLTARRAAPDFLTPLPRGLSLCGGARTADQASRYARVFITDMLDRQKDVTGYDIRVTVGPMEYWGIPFAFDKENRRLTDLTGGKSYSASILEILPWE